MMTIEVCGMIFGAVMAGAIVLVIFGSRAFTGDISDVERWNDE